MTRSRADGERRPGSMPVVVAVAGLVLVAFGTVLVWVGAPLALVPVATGVGLTVAVENRWPGGNAAPGAFLASVPLLVLVVVGLVRG